MKGRWFFWIPVMIYGLYLLYPVAIEYIDITKNILYSIGIIHLVIQGVGGLSYLTGSKQEKQDMINNSILNTKLFHLLLFTIPTIIILINYYFDKHLTIKKR